jgi:hypothetical protein
VLDQGNATGVSTADINVTNSAVQGGLAETDSYNNQTSASRQNTVYLDPANGTLNNNTFTATDLCGRVSHEIGHDIGLVNETCYSIMVGSNAQGQRSVNQIRQADVASVNRNFNNDSTCTADVGSSENEVCVQDGESPGSPYYWDTACCCWNIEGGGGGGGSCPDLGCNEGGGTQFPVDYCTFGGDGCPWPYHNVGSCCYAETSPIIVDVDGSGFHLTDAFHGVRFDFHGRGKPIKLSWIAVGSTNAFLVLDRNSNGTIENGTELFGNITPQTHTEEPNGFIALAEFDKLEHGGNVDGLITKDDAVFSLLKLWQDVNHNGFSEATELHTLPELGLTTLDLDYRSSRKTDQNGNQFRYRSKVRDTHDAQLGRWAWDAFLQVAP